MTVAMSSPHRANNFSEAERKAATARRAELEGAADWKVDPPAAGGQGDWKLDMEIAELLAEAAQLRNPTQN